ncbi:hypothetical protein UCREL1_10524 [Eutypa lata UCREL1]|uniref:Duf1770 domain containing protein n=1 Tax=Eutypa lata (strain UCR-EL1) TaxID=1287681 RepID=M7S8T2_EUTLA|nr:hypothetical protein UCREL1_10524 [Eutypa lata UCREL1]
MSNLPAEIASTIQAGHIQRSPSPRHDLNPSTAASQKTPVSLHQLHDDSDIDEIDEDEIPLSVLKPTPRGQQQQQHDSARHPHYPKHFPPMPDLRFEQSYLHSLAGAETWWRVAWITVRDQMMMPLAQGVLYNLAICGWQHWNRNAQVHGNSVGARMRRWWYGVNNWALPPLYAEKKSSRGARIPSSIRRAY